MENVLEKIIKQKKEDLKTVKNKISLLTIENKIIYLINKNIRINLFKFDYLNDLIKNKNEFNFSNPILRKIKYVDPISLFLDGEIIGFLPKESVISHTLIGNMIKNSSAIYKLLIRISGTTIDGDNYNHNLPLKRHLS